MVTVVRDKLLRPVRNLDHVQSAGHLHPDSVNLNIDQIFLVLGHIVIPGIH